MLQDEIIREENGKFYLVLKREESNVYKVNGETGVNWLFISLIVGVNVLFIAFLIAVKGSVDEMRNYSLYVDVFLLYL